MKITAGQACSATLVFLLGALLPAVSAAQEPEVTAQAINDHLYLLQGKGGNVVASIGADGALLVDDDYAEYQQAYAAALSDLGHSAPRFIINTHWHSDHTGGNGAWGKTGAVIMAHNNVRKRVSTDQEMAFFGRTQPASPAAAWPMLTYESSLALHFNGETLEMQHYPRGHTDGDSVVFFQQSNVVHVGDHFFKDRFPFVDLDSGGNVNSFIRNIAAMIQLVDDETVIVPGHGSLANKKDLQKYHNMLINTRAAVKDMQADGLSIPQMQERGLAARWQSWGSGFIDQASWISFIANSR